MQQHVEESVRIHVEQRDLRDCSEGTCDRRDARIAEAHGIAVEQRDVEAPVVVDVIDGDRGAVAEVRRGKIRRVEGLESGVVEDPARRARELYGLAPAR